MGGFSVQSTTIALARLSSRRFSVPVKATQTVHAQLSNVFGRAVQVGQNPVDLSRLRQIDRYISSFKGSKNPMPEPAPNPLSFPAPNPLSFPAANPIHKYRQINASGNTGFYVNVTV